MASIGICIFGGVLFLLFPLVLDRIYTPFSLVANVVFLHGCNSVCFTSLKAVTMG